MDSGAVLLVVFIAFIGLALLSWVWGALRLDRKRRRLMNRLLADPDREAPKIAARIGTGGKTDAAVADIAQLAMRQLGAREITRYGTVIVGWVGRPYSRWPPSKEHQLVVAFSTTGAGSHVLCWARPRLALRLNETVYTQRWTDRLAGEMQRQLGLDRDQLISEWASVRDPPWWREHRLLIGTTVFVLALVLLALLTSI